MIKKFSSGKYLKPGGQVSSLDELYWLAGWLIRCHALPENGFNSPLLQIHDNTEIPAPFCIDATTEEGGKTQIRNMNSCFHGC